MKGLVAVSSLAATSSLFALFSLGALASPALAAGIRGNLDTADLPVYLRDRGPGMPTSMFGTYVQTGQLLVYPFFESYHDTNYEYKPEDFGYSGSQDLRGDFDASEELLFMSYGFSDRVALEMEGALMQAELEKGAGDVSAQPTELKQSGLGDVEGQLRVRWANETTSHPEVFSYFETVIPTQREGALIGTTNWEFALGTGVTRGFGWGTLTARAAVGYQRDQNTFDLGELAVEYLKRVSPAWRIYGGIEDSQDEVEGITEVQWHFSRDAFLRLNQAVGLSSKATDWAPEVGIVFGL